LRPGSLRERISPDFREKLSVDQDLARRRPIDLFEGFSNAGQDPDSA
jgi:hypothetical protein